MARFTIKGAYGSNDKDVDLEKYIINKIDGDDHDRGMIEASRQTADNAGDVIAKLITILYKKRLLNDSDIEKVVQGVW